MSEDNIISMLTSATMKPADSAGFPDTDLIFQRRRGLSKLPVHAIDGEFFTSNIARFHMNGEVIDIPVAFGVAQFFEGLGGVVKRYDDEAFFAAIQSLVGAEMDSVYVICGSEGNPWMVFWDSREGIDIENEVAQLFYPSHQNEEAA